MSNALKVADTHASPPLRCAAPASVAMALLAVLRLLPVNCVAMPSRSAGESVQAARVACASISKQAAMAAKPPALTSIVVPLVIDVLIGREECYDIAPAGDRGR